ncbi:hypothetical protein DMENIID0001_112550 [Sergentomyia squamirostris]
MEDNVTENIDSNIEYYDNVVPDVPQNPEGFALQSENYQPKLIDKLRLLIVKHKLGRDCTNDLLLALQDHVDEDLPKDRRSIMQTPRGKPIAVKSVPPGTYYYIGIEESLKECPVDFFLKDEEEVVINIGIDGSPIGGKKSIMPILGHFVGRKNISPFLIGIYEGEKDPQDVNLYLHDLVEEIQRLEQSGVRVTTAKVLKPFRVGAFILDSKARAWIAGVIGYNGHHGCGKCEQIGHTTNSRVVYCTESANLRSDLSFQNRDDPLHHKFPYPYGLEHAKIGMISQLPLCPMHLVYLGVMRTMGVLWMNPKRGPNVPFRLTPGQREQLNIEHLGRSAFYPSEFSRRIDSLYYVNNWKATQARQFLLYAGPVVLRSLFDEEHYNHFLLLSVAVRILNSNVFTQNDQCVESADMMLRKFVEEYPSMYGEDQVTFNVHNLLHLTQDVRKYGTLEQFSAFPFENFLQTIKGMVDPRSSVIPQIINRLAEQKQLNAHIESGDLKFADKFSLKKSVMGCSFMYRTCKFNELTFKLTEGWMLWELQQTFSANVPKIELIHKWMAKREMGMKLRSVIMDHLPISSQNKLEDFETRLMQQAWTDEFEVICRNITVKEVFEDKLTLLYNLAGKYKKRSFKATKIYKIWKRSSGLSKKMFDKKISAEITSAHNRQFAIKSNKKRRQNQKKQNRERDELQGTSRQASPDQSQQSGSEEADCDSDSDSDNP